MTWVKLDDGFAEHPKVISLSDRAFRCFIDAICWSNRTLSDGVLPSGILDRIGQDTVGELSDAGLLDKRPWRIHDYLDYNPSREEVEEERRKARERQTKGGRSSGEVRAKKGSPVPGPVPVPKPEPELTSKSAAALAATIGKPQSENGYIAEALLAPDSRSRYFLERLRKRGGQWAKITDSAVMKLGGQFGPAIVIEALSYVYESDAHPSAAYPYLRQICQDRFDERVMA